jgi:hypothetical protein
VTVGTSDEGQALLIYLFFKSEMVAEWSALLVAM